LLDLRKSGLAQPYVFGARQEPKKQIKNRIFIIAPPAVPTVLRTTRAWLDRHMTVAGLAAEH
jgi:hypothetical protein